VTKEFLALNAKKLLIRRLLESAVRISLARKRAFGKQPNKWGVYRDKLKNKVAENLLHVLNFYYGGKYEYLE
jgi:hypothetical protein